VVKDPARERLVAFVFMSSDLDLEDLRLDCEEQLPAYMVPSRIIGIFEWPLTANGKVDHKKLLESIPLPEQVQESAWTAAERLVAEEVKVILDCEVLTPLADFFADLGGNSLSAARLVARLKQGVSLAQIFSGGGCTIRKIAAMLPRGSICPMGDDAALHLLSPTEPRSKVPKWWWIFSTLQMVLSLLIIAEWSFTVAVILYVIARYFPPINIVWLAVILVEVSSLVHALSFIAWCRLTWTRRYPPLRYQRFGMVHLHWWFMTRLWKRVTPWAQSWLDTPLYPWYLWALGAHIGKNTRICTTKIDNFNQLYIGDNVFVQDNVYIHNVRETPKFFIIERVIIGHRTVVGAASVLQHTKIGSECTVRMMSAVERDVYNGHEAYGSPLQMRPAQSPMGENPKCRWFQGTLLFLVAVILRLQAALWYGVLAWVLSNAIPKYWLFAIMPPLWLVFQHTKNFFWAYLVRVFSYGASSTTLRYGSWEYWRVQRLRLLIGRQVQFNSASDHVTRKLLNVMGMRCGKDVMVAGPTVPYVQVPPRFIYLGDSSTLTSAVWLGEELWQNGNWCIPSISIGSDTLVGDCAAVIEGHVPARCIVASLAVCTGMSAEEAATKSTMVGIGNPSMWTQYKEMPGEGVHIEMQGRHVFYHLGTELLSDSILVLDQIIGLGVAFGLHTFLNNRITGLALWWPLAVASEGAAIVGGAILVIGVRLGFRMRFQAGTYQMFSGWASSRSLLYSAVNVWMTRVNYWHNTALFNCVYRCLGAEIGTRVSIQSPTSLLEYDLLTIGKDNIVEDGAILQPHTFEKRSMACRRITVEDRVVVGASDLVFPGAYIVFKSKLRPLMLVMKDEHLTMPQRIAEPDPPSRLTSFMRHASLTLRRGSNISDGGAAPRRLSFDFAFGRIPNVDPTTVSPGIHPPVHRSGSARRASADAGGRPISRHASFALDLCPGQKEEDLDSGHFAADHKSLALDVASGEWFQVPPRPFEDSASSQCVSGPPDHRDLIEGLSGAGGSQGSAKLELPAHINDATSSNANDKTLGVTGARRPRIQRDSSLRRLSFPPLHGSTAGGILQGRRTSVALDIPRPNVEEASNASPRSWTLNVASGDWNEVLPRPAKGAAEESEQL